MAAPVPLSSSRTWDRLPGQTPVHLQGKSPKEWLRDTNERAVEAVFKFAADDGDADQMYELGIERVAYALAMYLDLPVPDTHLETFDRKRGVVQILRPNREWSRSWRLAQQMAMWGDIQNRDLWPLGVAFDVWIANVDRHHRNIVFEPIPPEQKPMLSGSCLTWLPDNGWAGLYPPQKFNASNVDNVTFDGQGRMRGDADRALRDRMPVEYREAFTSLPLTDRGAVLDLIRAVPDDAIDGVVSETPTAYFSARAKRRTVALLKARRDAVDTLASEVF